jgi:hypothetical protein
MDKTQTENGPPKYVDDNGVVRVTIKQGTPARRAAGILMLRFVMRTVSARTRSAIP